ncbi:hypothetical protein [Vibrio harveyi]|uniref:hypothetical protein n=1 Tax=Vibrio harveyi TaxID=669 RepID=UPI0023807197|nr:hypothetical protein [Vibrio harveyi]
MLTAEVILLARKFNNLSSDEKKAFLHRILESTDGDMIFESLNKSAGLESAQTINFAPQNSAKCPVCGK